MSREIESDSTEDDTWKDGLDQMIRQHCSAQCIQAYKKFGLKHMPKMKENDHPEATEA